MNTSYCIVWNATTGKWVVASQWAKGRQKASSRVHLLSALALAVTMPVAMAVEATEPTGKEQQANSYQRDEGLDDAEPYEEPSLEPRRIMGLGAGTRGSGAANLADADPVTRYFKVAGKNDGTDDARLGVSGGHGIAIGAGAKALYDFADRAAGIAIGWNAVSNASRDIAFGADATADASQGGAYATALGSNATAIGGGTLAVGERAAVNGSNNTRYNGTALGASAQVSARNATAVGATASATAQNSVALGMGSVADRANTVSIGASGASRQLVNVAAGTQDTDAVNVGQLKGTASSVANALGGGATVAADGTLTAPSYSVQGTTYNNVGAALNGVDSSLTSLDGRVTKNEGDITTINSNLTRLDGQVTQNTTNITNLQQQISDGSVGLVQQDKSSGNLTVGANVGGSEISMAGNAGPRIVSGVANGTEDTDAATIAQLKAMGLFDPNTRAPLAAVVYDGIDLSKITLGGSNGTTIANLANGLIASGSMEAINGGQLFDLKTMLEGKIGNIGDQITNIDNRVGKIEQGIADGSIGAPAPADPGLGYTPGTGDNSMTAGRDTVASGSNSSAVGNGSQATGNDSTAVGAGSVASGDKSTAIGAGSKASADNSVALGAGSVADRENTVSVGSAGNERQITHVAAGTERTDAANWGQVQDAVGNLQNWAQGNFDGLSRKIDNVQRQANRGIAASAALVNNMPYLPGKVTLNAGAAGYRGEAALGLGVSRWSEDGRFNINAGISSAKGDAPIFRVGVGVVLGD